MAEYTIPQGGTAPNAPEQQRVISFQIVEHICDLCRGSHGRRKEINLVSWNGRPPRLDIRFWDEEHKEPGHGISLHDDEVVKLREYLNRR